MPHDVFISYSTKDSPVAVEVCAYLEGKGLKCWMAPQDLLPGQTWAQAIPVAIGGCAVFVLLGSANAYASKWVRREVHYADGDEKPVLTFRLDDAAMPEELRFILGREQWLDSLTEPRDAHFGRLAEAVQGMLDRPKAEPPPVEHKPAGGTHATASAEPAIPAKPAVVTPPGPKAVAVPAGGTETNAAAGEPATRVEPTPTRRPRKGAEPWLRPGTRLGEEITGPDGGKMVWVPPGEFMMGSTDEDVAYAVQSLRRKKERLEHEQPAHKVRITKGFWLGKFVVTNEEYRAFCQATRRAFPEERKNGPNHPVVCVSWEDAKAYCDRYGLALPTEAQWEYGARGPQSLRYPWGNDWDPKKCCSNENKGPGGIGTMEVGSLPAGDSWCGASDMAGNVWEWCADWYDDGYYAKPPPDDPPGPSSGEGRLLRGGSWYGDADLCRSAGRAGGDPGDRGHDLGFRVARTP